MNNLNQILPTLASDIIKLSLRHVFFAAIIMHMRRVVTRTGTAAIDGRTLWINPEFYNPLPLEERISLLAHEADHVARLHPVRGAEFGDRLTWNMATDQVINRDLRKCGYKLPEGGVHLDDSLDLTAEQWYERLKKEQSKKAGRKKASKQPPQSGDESGDQSGDESGDQSGDESGDQSGDESGDQSGDESGDQSGDESGDQSRDGQPCSGDGAGESPLREDEGSGWGDVVEPQKGGDDGDGQRAPVTEAELRQLVSSALATSRGTLPAAYAKEIAEGLQPVEDWRALLADFLTTQLSREDRSFRRENTRYSGGLIMPVMHSEAHGTIAVCMDTSASVNDERVGQFLAEIDSLRRELRAEVEHSHCDTCHSGWERVRVDDDLPRGVKNRGGTDFAPIMDALKDAEWDGEAPSCAVIFTDGECDSFGDDPSIPVLWMHAPYNMHLHFAPPFGRVVTMRKYS
jgi:predicted metal-dependent peptidase